MSRNNSNKIVRIPLQPIENVEERDPRTITVSTPPPPQSQFINDVGNTAAAAAIPNIGLEERNNSSMAAMLTPITNQNQQVRQVDDTTAPVRLSDFYENTPYGVKGPVYKLGQDPENSVGIQSSCRQSGQRVFTVANFKRALNADTVTIDFSKSPNCQMFHLSTENLKAISKLIPLLEAEAHQCDEVRMQHEQATSENEMKGFALPTFKRAR